MAPASGRRAALRLTAAALLAGAWPRGASAFDPAEAAGKVARLRPSTGTARIEALKLTIKLPSGLGLLDAAQTKFLFTDIYGNPPEDSDEALASILPVPPEPGAPGSFEIIVRSIAGRVPESGPGADLDPAKVEADFHAKIEALNAMRREGGDVTFDDPRIAEPAVYDPVRHALTVARSFQWSDEAQASVNYDTILLSRDGAAQLTATGTIQTLPRIKSAMQSLLPAFTFDPDQAYEGGAKDPPGAVTLEMLASNRLE